MNAPIDTRQLEELKYASSLIEAPNIDKRPDENRLKKMLSDPTDIKERNKKILKVSHKEGYSQHMIAKILGISQPAVNGVIQRSKD